VQRMLELPVSMARMMDVVGMSRIGVRNQNERESLLVSMMRITFS
jgi:hypothetical protein